MFLAASGLNAYFGEKKVLFDVSVEVAKGEIVALIGPNGAGKTTLLRSIFGIHRQRHGTISFDGKDISSNGCLGNLLAGISYIPQGGRVFRDLTVRDNLIMGGYLIKDSSKKMRRISEIYDLFPILSERQRQLAGTLSGGERQMLAIGLSVMLTPQMMLLDEPSIGLAPFLVPRLMETIQTIRKEYGSSVLIVEQNAPQVLKISDRVYVMKVGRITDVDHPNKFSSKDVLRKVFLSDVQ